MEISSITSFFVSTITE